MNRWILTGNLGKDPEMNYSPSGVAVTKFSIAVNEYNFSKKQKETTWYNIVALGALAERCNQYLHTGSKVLVEGRHSARKYNAKDGTEKVWIENVAANVEFLSPAGNSNGGKPYTDEPDDLGDLSEHPF